MTQPKLCKDCKYFKPYESDYHTFSPQFCKRKDVVMGILPAEREINLIYGGTCGPEAKYFEAKESREEKE